MVINEGRKCHPLLKRRLTDSDFPLHVSNFGFFVAVRRAKAAFLFL
jgi:hypothetical protein